MSAGPAHCYAVQYSDQMYCGPCMSTWGTNDGGCRRFELGRHPLIDYAESYFGEYEPTDDGTNPPTRIWSMIGFTMAATVAVAAGMGWLLDAWWPYPAAALACWTMWRTA